PAPGMTIDYEDAVAVGGLSIRLLRPSVPEELFAVAADARGDAPYWAELWPCARSLAAHLATLDLTGMRVLELGCGLALPSLVAALRGADVLASDVSADALERVAESGRRTLGRPLATLQADLHDRRGHGCADPEGGAGGAVRLRLAGLGDPAGHATGGAGVSHRAVASRRR